MKSSILIGTMLGVVAATVIYNTMEAAKPVKKTKKMIVDKIEDMLNI